MIGDELKTKSRFPLIDLICECGHVHSISYPGEIANGYTCKECGAVYLTENKFRERYGLVGLRDYVEKTV